MLDGGAEGRRPHMLCHNYRRAPAVMLARELVASGKLGQHLPLPRHLPAGLDRRPRAAAPLALPEGEGRLGRARRHPLALARPRPLCPGRRGHRGRRRARDLHQEAAAARRTRRRRAGSTVDDAALSLVRFANGALGSIEGTRFAAGPQELQPLRGQRQQGQRRLQPRAHERARVLLARRRRQRAGLPRHHGHRARPPPSSAAGGRRGTSSATSTPSPTPSTTS